MDNKFLDEKIKPWIVVFIQDGTNINEEWQVSPSKMNKPKHEVSLFEKQGPNNVAINLNKFIAKYDFDIARKLMKNEEKESLYRDQIFVREQFRDNAIMEILQICSNELSKDGEYF